MNETYQTLRTSVDDNGIAHLMLTSAGRGNPFGVPFWKELPDAVQQLSRNDAARVIIIRTDEPHFTYGLNLLGSASELMPAINGQLEGRLLIQKLGSEMQQAFDTVALCSKPVIAAINGWCIGAGVDLISACDIRVASADAKFSVREVKVGMVPDLGSIQRLPYIIGEGNARLLALTGCDITAERARAIGLVSDVFDNQVSLIEGALKIAQEIAANPPRVVTSIKQILNTRIEPHAQAALREALQLNSSLIQSDDFKEAIAAFLERRTGRFVGT